MRQNRALRYEKFLFLLIMLTLAFIWGNSLLSREVSSGMSHGILDLIRPMLEYMGIETDSDRWLRKLAHFCEFALLGAEFVGFSLQKGKRCFVDFGNCALSCLAAAFVDETLQYFSGRYPHILDVALDFFGSIYGIAIACIIYKSLQKHSKKSV